MYFNCSVLSPRGVTSRCPGLGSQRTFYANVRAVTRGSYSDSDYGDSDPDSGAILPPSFPPSLPPSLLPSDTVTGPNSRSWCSPQQLTGTAACHGGTTLATKADDDATLAHAIVFIVSICYFSESNFGADCFCPFLPERPGSPKPEL